MVFIYHWLLWWRERYDVLIQTFSSIIPHNKAGDYATDYLLYQDRTSQHSPIRHTLSEVTMCGRRNVILALNLKWQWGSQAFFSVFSFAFPCSLSSSESLTSTTKPLGTPASPNNLYSSTGYLNGPFRIELRVSFKVILICNIELSKHDGIIKRVF